MDEDENDVLTELMRSGPVKLINERTAPFNSADHNIELRLLELYSNLVQELTGCAEDTESEVSRLQYLVRAADKHLHEELDEHQEKVDVISDTIDRTISNFKRASDSAVRIGERLATSENERKRLVRAIELMRCIKTFESTDAAIFINATGLNNDELMEVLPDQLHDKNWGEISYVRLTYCLLVTISIIIFAGT
jgi:archaellum component FlaC